MEAEPTEEDTKQSESSQQDPKDSTIMEEGSPSKEGSGKKRKSSGSPNRRSASPEEAKTRRRSRSPIRENEPPIDSDKVLLSWCKYLTKLLFFFFIFSIYSFD